jgi:hypothetical protein
MRRLAVCQRAGEARWPPPTPRDAYRGAGCRHRVLWGPVPPESPVPRDPPGDFGALSRLGLLHSLFSMRTASAVDTPRNGPVSSFLYGRKGVGSVRWQVSACAPLRRWPVGRFVFRGTHVRSDRRHSITPQLARPHPDGKGLRPLHPPDCVARVPVIPLEVVPREAGGDSGAHPHQPTCARTVGRPPSSPIPSSKRLRVS